MKLERFSTQRLIFPLLFSVNDGRVYDNSLEALGNAVIELLELVLCGLA
jgi:hypothetical protein